MNIHQVMIEAHKRAAFSTCADKQVGCVLLSADGTALAKGFNHVLGGNLCDACITRDKASIHCPAVHAEMSALMLLVARGLLLDSPPTVAVCTLEPCIECTKALVLSGVKEIYYDKSTNPRKTGKSFFQIVCPTGIWKQLSINNGGDSVVP